MGMKAPQGVPEFEAPQNAIDYILTCIKKLGVFENGPDQVKQAALGAFMANAEQREKEGGPFCKAEIEQVVQGIKKTANDILQFSIDGLRMYQPAIIDVKPAVPDSQREDRMDDVEGRPQIEDPDKGPADGPDEYQEPDEPELE
jgi:hypothetical protein